jgi:hypothetical protein
MKKQCIWCLEYEPKVTFEKDAHIFPKSLNGNRICEEVCDSCNIYFGSKQNHSTPSVEIALKEPLNISRSILLENEENQKSRFKSEYFNFDRKNLIIKPQRKYCTISGFQKSFAKQFRRGIYKVFLEERSKSIGDAFHERFNFIREFSRWGIGDCPVFYCKPKITAGVYVEPKALKNPYISFTEATENEMIEFGFYSNWFVSHFLAFPTIRTYEITLDNYRNYILFGKNSIHSDFWEIKEINDLDFMFRFVR